MFVFGYFDADPNHRRALSTRRTTNFFLNLTSGTTYYLRIRAANGDGFLTGFLGPVSTQTLSDPPTGLFGTALGVSSITWQWNSVVGASSYNLYMATSPTTLIANINSGTTYNEVGLSTNVAYGRVVTAVNAGGESALSASATTYTFASIPTIPCKPSGVTAPSPSPGRAIKALWARAYEVSISTDNTFVTMVSTPITIA